MLYLSEGDVKSLLSYAEVVQSVESGMRSEGEGRAKSVDRIDLAVGPANPGGVELVPGRTTMSIWIAGSDDVGGSIRSLSRGGRFALYIDNSGTPEAIIDFRLLQLYRTGAAAAVATKYLARPESRRVGIIGAGRYARATLAAHAAVMGIEEALIFSPTKEHRENFAHEMSSELKVEVHPVKSAASALTDADVVIVCTNLNGRDDPPGLEGSWLHPGVHVIANGGANEVDVGAYERASRIVVDDLAEMKSQIWDIKRAVERGICTWDELTALPDIVAGNESGRGGPEEITMARNRGNGVQDLFPIALLYRKATQTGAGRELGKLLLPLVP